MLPHSLTNLEIQKYYHNKPKFNGVHSRNNLPKTRDGAYVINLDEFNSIGAHWIVRYFDSLGTELSPPPSPQKRKNKNFIGNINIITNIYWIQTNDLIMCKYFCIGFINFMLKGKSLLNYTNLFSPNEHVKNDKITTKYFQ